MKPTAQAFNDAVAHLYALPSNPDVLVEEIGPEHVMGLLCQLYAASDSWLEIAANIDGAVDSIMDAHTAGRDAAEAFGAWWQLAGTPYAEVP